MVQERFSYSFSYFSCERLRLATVRLRKRDSILAESSSNKFSSSSAIIIFIINK